MDWKARLGLKKKSRREKMQEAASEVIHKVADTLDEAVTETRRQAPKVVQSVQDSSQVNAMLAALGGLTANWDEILQTVEQELAERKQRKEQHPKKAKKKAKSYPGFWIWLLRLGVGFWFIERLRSRDVADYIDHGAGEEMRLQSRHHPIEGYKDLLDTLLIPNASLVALATLAAEALVALGFITGLNRRLAALLGIVLSSNELLAHHDDSEKRGQDLLVFLSQLLLLRTGG